MSYNTMRDTPDGERSQREAEIVDNFLPEGYSASADAVAASPRSGNGSPLQNAAQDEEQSSLVLQGGDMHRDIFKIKARALAPKRSHTFSASNTPRLQPQGQRTVPETLEPGGFRRHYIENAQPRRPTPLRRGFNMTTAPVTSNFVSFLELYGSFAGEDLRDTDDDDESSAIDEESPSAEAPNETRPLLGRRKGSKKARREGDAGTVKTFFTLLKAFVGTGILFLPKAFSNGGILFSSVTLVTVSIISTICFRLLLQCRKQCGGGGYGELGAAIIGPKFRSVVLTSIAISQLGFVCTGVIFTAENILSFLNAVVKLSAKQPFGTNSLIAIQLLVLIPLALIRNISKLGPTALLADVFILIGLIYIWYYDISALSTVGMAPTVALFHPSTFGLTIGSSIFTFEGIGLILPIQSSMKHPEKFSKLLYLVMFIITVIFTSVGALCYATFGDETKIQIISNFPQNSPVVNTVQFLYSMAVLAGGAVQLFPASRIIEVGLFGEQATGKKSSLIKWEKNALRAFLMTTCGAISIVGASDLDKFVALIGAFACVPLVYIYPPFLHYRGVAVSWYEKALDVVLMVLGSVAMVYCSVFSLKQWIDN